VAAVNSPEIRRSQLNLNRSRELLNATQSQLKSNLSLVLTPIEYNQSRQFNDLFSTWYTNENYTWYGTLAVRQPIVLTDGTLTLSNRLSWQNAYSGYQDVRTKAYTNNIWLAYNQPLFTYNRTKLSLSELELALEDAALSHSLQQLNLERQVTGAFYDVYREQERLVIAREEYENQQQNYAIIKAKAESGLIAREELFQAEVNLANSNSSWQNQDVVVENIKDDFKILLGLSLMENISVQANIRPVKTEVELDKAIEHALRSRQEIRQREIDLVYAENDIIRASATNEFRGDLSLALGIFGDDPVLPEVYQNPTNSPRVSLSFNIPLWDWGERKSRIRAAEAMVQSREISMSDQQNDIVYNIRRIYRNLINLENQIVIAGQSQRNAQLTYEINLERYQNGDLTGMELNQYQNQLSQARMDMVSAQINYQMELLNMKIQSLWDFEANRSVVPDEVQNK